MKYACLIYSDEQDTVANPDPSTEAFAPMMAGYFAFGEKNGEKIAAGEALQSVATATSVRVRDGETVATDGPFAETKEQLGGFYIVEADDLDEAISMAIQIPHAHTGTIEVRPVMNFD
jgi:hypothetical protein